MLVRGDPGIGKSHLLRRAAGLAADAGWTVLRSPESKPRRRRRSPVFTCCWARCWRSRTYARRATAGHGGRPSAWSTGPPPELFLVALAVLSLLTEKAAAGPIMLVDRRHAVAGLLDQRRPCLRGTPDQPGSDPDHRRRARGTLGPVFRRGTRMNSNCAAWTTTPSRQLLAVAAEPDFGDQDAILRAAAGNPLALIELPWVWRVRQADRPTARRRR